MFEQLPDPHRVLREVRRILQPRGIAVIRTPNAAFYIEREKRREERDIIAALGHANLLGFPHLYGYTPASLGRLVDKHGLLRPGRSAIATSCRRCGPSTRPRCRKGSGSKRLFRFRRGSSLLARDRDAGWHLVLHQKIVRRG